MLEFIKQYKVIFDMILETYLGAMQKNMIRFMTEIIVIMDETIFTGKNQKVCLAKSDRIERSRVSSQIGVRGWIGSYTD